MKKEMNNKGFSLVELIIVVAIMAVLIGVLAPAYLQYVEKSKKTKDAQAIGSIMDGIEIVSSDPSITWTAGDMIKVTVDDTGVAYTDSTATDAEAKLATIVPAGNKTTITGSWGSIEFEGTKDRNGFVVFDITGATGIDKAQLADVSAALEARFNS